MRKTAVPEEWPRLALAAADTCDALRRLIPRLDAALRDGQADPILLEDVRAIAEPQSIALVLALKGAGQAARPPKGRFSAFCATVGRFRARDRPEAARVPETVAAARGDCEPGEPG